MKITKIISQPAHYLWAIFTFSFFISFQGSAAQVVVGPPCQFEHSYDDINNNRDHHTGFGAIDATTVVDIGANSRAPINDAGVGLWFQTCEGDVAIASIGGVVSRYYSNCENTQNSELVIQGDDGISVTYLHMDFDAANTIANGARVNAGDIIGTIGSVGCSTFPHIHFGVKRDGNRLNYDQWAFGDVGDNPNNPPVDDPPHNNDPEDPPLDDWWCEYVHYLHVLGVLEHGCIAVRDNPNLRVMNRAKFATMMGIAIGITEAFECPNEYNDVPDDAEFEPYVRNLSHLSYDDATTVLTIPPEQLFRPFDQVNRCEAVKMIVEALDLYDVADAIFPPEDFYEDADQIDPWCRSPVKTALRRRILNPSPGQDGRVLFRPAELLSFEEASSLVARALQGGHANDLDIDADDFTDEACMPGGIVAVPAGEVAGWQPPDDPFVDSFPIRASDGLVPGEILEPDGSRDVSNRGFDVEWRNGGDERLRQTGTALFCRRDGGLPVRYGGFETRGDIGHGRVTEQTPGSFLECFLRTRLSIDRDVWVNSDTVEYQVSPQYAQMRVDRIEEVEAPWYGCDDVELNATIHNQGTDAGMWVARAYLHPEGAGPNHPQAVQAAWNDGTPMERFVSLSPGENRSLFFQIPHDFPFPLERNETEVTVVISDELRGIGPSHHSTLDVFVQDDEAPEINLFRMLNGLGENGLDFVPGRTHVMQLQAEDDHWIDHWSFQWSIEGQNQWQDIAVNFGDSCQQNLLARSVEWPVPEGLAANTQIEIRFQVWDLVGRLTEQTKIVTIRDVQEPSAFFVQPAAGDVYYEYDGNRENCVPVEIRVVPGIPIFEIKVGWSDVQEQVFHHEESIYVFPENGVVEACIKARYAGENVKAAILIEDQNLDEHMFYSDPIRIEINEPCSPWSPFHMEETQFQWSAEGPKPKGGVQYNITSIDEEQVTVLRRDYRDWPLEDGFRAPERSELSFSQLTFSRQDYALIDQVRLMQPFEEDKQNQVGDELPITLEGIRELGLTTSVEQGEEVQEDIYNYSLATRFTTPNGVTPAQVVAEYLNTDYTKRPSVRWKIQTDDGSWLMAVRKYLVPEVRFNLEYVTELFRYSNNRWNRIQQDTGLVKYPMFVDGQLWVFRRDRFDLDEDGTYDVVHYMRVVLDAETGNVLNELEIYAKSYTGSEDYFVGKDPQTGNVHLLIQEHSTNQYTLTSYGENEWLVHAPQSLGNEWHGYEVSNVYPEEVTANGGHVFVRVNFRVDEIDRYKRGFIRINPEEPVDLSLQVLNCDELERTGDSVMVTPNGRLVRTRSNDWNFEGRLFIQETVRDESCWDGSECTQDMWAYDVPECQYVQRACEQDGNACNGPEVCVPETGQCETDAVQAVDCDDGDMCNGFEWCDPQNGECSPGEPFDMGDGFMCTQEVCENGEFDVFEDNDACRLDACRAFRCDPYHDDADPETGCVYDRLPLIEDGLDCTVALACDPVTGETLQGVVAGTCLIDDRCVAEGTVNPENPCEICEPLQSVDAWTQIPAGQQGCAVLSDGDMEGNSFPWSGFSIWPRCIFGDEAAFEGDQGLLCTAGKSVEISPIDLLPGQSYALEFMHRIVEGRAFVFFYFERDGLNISVEGTPIQLGGPTQQWSQNRTLFQTPEDFGGTAKIIIISLGETHIDNLSIDFVNDEVSLLSQGDVEDATYEWQPYGANVCVPTEQIAFEGNRALQCGPGRQGTRTEAFALEPQQLFRFDFMYLTEAPYFLAYLNKAGSNDKVPGAFFANMSSSQEWLPYSRLLRAPHTEGREFYEALFSSRGLTYVDDIRIVPVPEGRSLIHQGDFEFTHSTAWNRFDGHPACVATEEAVWRGSQGLQCAQGQGIEQAFIPVLPNQLYRFRGIYEIHEGAAEVELGWYRSKLEPIEPVEDASVILVSQEGQAPEWRWHETVFQTPAEINGDLRLRFYSDGHVYFDRWSLLPIEEE